MTKIKRIPVTSEIISEIGYNPVTKEMDVAFKSHTKPGTPPKPLSVYRYQSVGPDTHAALMSADSIGRYFTETIKKHPETYAFKKLAAEEAA